MRPVDVVDRLLKDRNRTPGTEGRAYAPVNIALCKYWGKRDRALRLPVTSSLSVSLPELGADTTVRPAETADRFILNGHPVPATDPSATRLSRFLDLFRGDPHPHFEVCSASTVPLAAGLASSASGFAALVLALDAYFAWNLDRRALSILARLGSGSACRSVYDGFVEWHAGERADGMDSFAEPLRRAWPGLCVGWLRISDAPKAVSSREAMERTTSTSPLYRAWPGRVANDLHTLRTAIREGDFETFGRTAESNALAMHATMLDSWPPILYWHPRTVEVLHDIWRARAEGLPCYFTMDAGPNVKLLFERASRPDLCARFPGINVIEPFCIRS